MPTENIASVEDCSNRLFESLGPELIVAAPLGIGKPNHLLNALWSKARADSSLTLEIFTALSLQIPQGKSLLERRFLQAFTQRHFHGQGGYPELDYINDIQLGDVPHNMRVSEFYMQSGKYLSSPLAQRWYTSSNYTHAARDIVNRGVNVLVLMVGCRDAANAESKTRYSLGSNPDLTLDLVKRIKARNSESGTQPAAHPFHVVAVVNRNMPFMTGVAEVSDDFFDFIIDQPDYEHTLFAVPREPIATSDYHIGLNCSALVSDGGTLQIGIGSLGDAFVYATMLRHQHAAQYRQILRDTGIEARSGDVLQRVAGPLAQLGAFEKGLYAASEMFTEGFMHLYKAGILKRRVYHDLTVQTLLNQGKISASISLATLDAFREARALTNRLDQHEIDWLIRIGAFQPGIRLQGEQLVTANGTAVDNNLGDDSARQAIADHCLGSKLSGAALLHAAFFLGSKDFYRWLHALDDSERELFQMTGVGQINELYNYDLPNGEARDRAQRLRARFINSTMKVSLTGAAISDGLANHQVVSGVGGQYNFVAMAHALADSRSIIMLRATRHSAKGVVSNIVWQYPYETIPRHLRDIVITEYGVADLRGKCDEDCVKAMLCVADSRFQANLLKQAQQHNKLDPAWAIPAAYRNNTPGMLARGLQRYRDQGLFTDYPFGCDFNDQELQLVEALRWLKSRSATRSARLLLLVRALRSKANANQLPLLALMQLHNTASLAQWLNKKLLLLALHSTANKNA